jgi:hypothetical protein
VAIARGSCPHAGKYPSPREIPPRGSRAAARLGNLLKTLHETRFAPPFAGVALGIALRSPRRADGRADLLSALFGTTGHLCPVDRICVTVAPRMPVGIASRSMLATCEVLLSALLAGSMIGKSAAVILLG